ncbi:MAG TPA: sigma-70 family RNA polymerase sigma factor [Pirellulales bacterium]|nr:sigma-70 family RNA polymerase sigma factor [Pirellulales bacterium]
MSKESEIETRERLSRLWGESEALVQAFVFSGIRDFQDAEDVVQQVALTVARRFDEYDESRPFVAWAIWLAKSRIADYYRDRGRERRVFSEAILNQIAAVLVQRQPERSARQEALEQCIEKLPQKSRRLIELRYMEQKSVESVAKAIDCTTGAVRVMLFRIRDMLADCIQSQLAREAQER